jgi:hypothetical protein
MSDQAAIAISAQQAALRTIAIAAGFQTDLGTRVLSAPYQPDGEDPSACIYRSGPLGMDQVRDLETYRMTVTWSALVTGAPDELDGMALAAQSDMIRALRKVCANTQLRRVDIPVRDQGSNTLVASVSISTALQEVAP